VNRDNGKKGKNGKESRQNQEGISPLDSFKGFHVRAESRAVSLERGDTGIRRGQTEMCKNGNTETVEAKAFRKFVSLIPESVKERLIDIKRKVTEGPA